MNPAVLNKEVQEYINAHLGEDISRILLRKSPFKNVSSRELAEQIEAKKSSEKKLPTWFNTERIYFPSKLSIEQTSSELTAQYKAGLIKGEKLIDVTGGFGVDSYFFSKNTRSVVHTEINSELSTIAKHNAKILGVSNITFIEGDGIEYLKDTPEVFDTIYIDPSRRVKSQKVFFLSECEPDVVANLDLLLSKSERIIIKTSPLLDIQSGLRELKNVSQIHIVSVRNDCKELLWIIDKDFSDEPEIKCVALTDHIQTFLFKPAEEKQLSIEAFSLPEKYLYEPDVALLKAGSFKLISKRFDLKKLSPNTHLYTSDFLKDDFLGRKFKVILSQTYKDFIRSKNITKANIISRNFPLSPAEIKKKHKLEDGGNHYLIFTKGPSEQLITIHAHRI